MDSPVINSISLCAGGAGLDRGVELALGATRTVCWVEWEAFAIEYLASCMEALSLHPAPIWTDVRTFDGRPWRGVVDCITAGYPCQPFSLAGKRGGSDDPRHLWPQVRRVIGEVEPSIVFLENVPGHLSLGAEQVLAELQEMGFEAAPGLFTAEEVGGSHKRERLFILALADAEHGARRREAPQRRPRIRIAAAGPSGGMVCPLFPPAPDDLEAWKDIPTYLWPATEPGLCDLVDGLAVDRAARQKLLGNGVVPLQAAYAFISLWSALRGNKCLN